MGVKRPSHKADPVRLAEAESLRRAGNTYDEIEGAVGITRGALCQHFKRVGLARGQVADEARAEDSLEADRSRRALRKTRRAIEAVADVIYTKAKPGVKADGTPRDAEIDAKELAALTAAMRECGKLERLYRGRPTSHSKSETSAAPAGPTDDEKRLLDLADRADLG